MNDFNWRRPITIGTPAPKPSRAKAPQAGRALDMQGRRTVDLAPRTLGAISIHNVVDTNKSQRISRGRSI
jgi:hypothetical protein